MPEPRAKLQRLRAEAGLSQSRVARRAGISRSAYAMIELGLREPRMITQKRLADIFGVTVDELFFCADGHDTRLRPDTGPAPSLPSPSDRKEASAR